MKIFKEFGAVVAVVMILVGLLLVGSSSPRAKADTVVGYQTMTLWSGATAYTTTTYSNGYLAGGFGEFSLQINNEISGTGTITVTPQFSNDLLACGATGKNWADATIAGTYVAQAYTTTVASVFSYGVVDVYKTLTGDGDLLLRFPMQGRCGRIKVETSTTFTPTSYILMLNIN